MKQRKNLNDWINNLVDKDGIKTEVTLVIPDDTLRKVTWTIVGVGTGVILLHHLLKNTIPNRQVGEIQKQLRHIQTTLKS